MTTTMYPTRSSVIADYAAGLLTRSEYDDIMQRIPLVSGKPDALVLPHEMRVGDIVSPAWDNRDSVRANVPGQHEQMSAFESCYVEKVDDGFVHLARPYVMRAEHTLTMLMGVERYPVEVSSRHLVYRLWGRA